MKNFDCRKLLSELDFLSLMESAFKYTCNENTRSDQSLNLYIDRHIIQSLGIIHENMYALFKLEDISTHTAWSIIYRGCLERTLALTDMLKVENRVKEKVLISLMVKHRNLQKKFRQLEKINIDCSQKISDNNRILENFKTEYSRITNLDFSLKKLDRLGWHGYSSVRELFESNGELIEYLDLYKRFSENVHGFNIAESLTELDTISSYKITDEELRICYNVLFRYLSTMYMNFCEHFHIKLKYHFTYN
ncbi:DUF5677 domain-containing protein [Enterococcus sp. MSG3310]|uniref:DUF5677 domain-containing protein n=1 Tax=Enterococcus sp. MSG3310 TaxID=2774835 RepID=UPI003D3014A3